MTDEQIKVLCSVQERKVFLFPDIRTDAGVAASDRVSCARVWNYFKKNLLDSGAVGEEKGEGAKKRYRTYRLVAPARVEALLRGARLPRPEAGSARVSRVDSAERVCVLTTLRYRLADGRFAELTLPPNPTARELHKLFGHLQIDLLDTAPDDEAKP